MISDEVAVRDHKCHRLIPAQQRFWDRVEKGSGCWLWLGPPRSRENGYGRIQVARRSIPTHRFAYELLVGPIPDGLCVLHKCDNPACVRPDHLFLGTRGDNTHDAVSKGRNARGEKIAQSRLTAGQVEEIRVVILGRKLSIRCVARLLGMNEKSVRQIVNGEHWRHLLGTDAA